MNSAMKLRCRDISFRLRTQKELIQEKEDEEEGRTKVEEVKEE